MTKLMAAILAGGMFTAAQAAPRAESAVECGIAADMAVVAHSLAKEQVQRPKAKAIMFRIYDVSESARGKELMGNIIDAAYTSNGASAQKFGEDLFAACMKSGGSMDTILGRRS